jgi:hypothetical protein
LIREGAVRSTLPPAAPADIKPGPPAITPDGGGPVFLFVGTGVN